MASTERLSERPPRRRRAELLAALGAAVLASAVGIWVLQLWKANLSAPFVVGGDSNIQLLDIKDIVTHGWDFTNPNLGAPFGQELYDYPSTSGDNLNLAIIKVLGIASANPALLLNILFLSGFPLIAAVAYGVLRRLRISMGVAVVCAALYAVLPFRFGSTENHVFLASYFLVPVCCLLILAVLDGRELFVRGSGRSGPRAYLTRRSAAVVALCVVLSESGNYYALFTVALTVPAAILTFLAIRRPRPLLGGFAAVSIMLGMVAVNGLPTLIYSAEHGRDTVPGRRLPQETEWWGLSAATLVLPIEENRIAPLAELTRRYSSTTVAPASGPTSEPSWTNLGFVGTLGLLWLMVALAVRSIGGAGAKRTDPRASHAGLAAGMAFLIGTVGGLGTIFAYVVSPQIHAPGRIAVFIAFFALFGAALGLDRLRRRLGGGRGGRAAFAAVLVGVLLVGVLSQTSPAMVPEYAVASAHWESEGAAVRAIEARLPRDASIFQIPYVPFPEGSPPGRIGEDEDLMASLHSNGLRWTGGAMQGRSTNWVPAFLERSLPQILEGVSAVGFEGLWVNTAGLPHGAAGLLELRRALGVAPLTSGEGRFAFFGMAAYNRRFRAGHSAAQIAGIAAAALHLRG